MKRVVYYISEYGFGHASRSIAIIRDLINLDPTIQIEVVHNYALDFLVKSLPFNNITFYRLGTDIGYFLKDQSIEPDKIKQTEEVLSYSIEILSLAQVEINRLNSKKIDLIISDISPIAFEVADKIGVPSIGISNFTWYTAFQGLVSERHLLFLKEAYGKMDYFFGLAGNNEIEWGRSKSYQIRFYSRNIDQDEVERIRNGFNKDKQLVFLGLGMKMDLDNLKRLQIWNSYDTHFVVSSNLPITHPNVSHVPKEYIETQNYIAACDLVITKAGWGTIGEAIVGNTPLLIIDRNNMKEDKNTISFLTKYNLCNLITWDEFSQLTINEGIVTRFRDKLSQSNYSISNETSRISEKILEILVGSIV
ncbi:glycosyltransferase [Bacillus sp. JJ1566]|uniref:glycosyltransferase n=1 Tax=Bacillus sp. JJ1566 TaxID=3122961 RepID=UPI002FFDB3FF